MAIDKSIYLGDPRLKAPNVDIEWSEHDIEEYGKCFDDIIYFIKNYMKIVHIDDGIIPFDMYDYQKLQKDAEPCNNLQF